MCEDLMKLFRKAPETALREKYAAHASPIEFDWDWDSVNYNRVAVVNRLIAHVGSMPSRYLEIGCFDDELFNAVCADEKTGVDPARGGTHRMTSDAFFKQNESKFDVIFIDGLHEYPQVQRDLLNAIDALDKGGMIALHDLLPRNWLEHHVPRLNPSWTGDCWKVACELARSEGLDFRVVRVDHGVGVLRKTGEKIVYPNMMDDLEDEQFDRFANEVPGLPIITWQEFCDWL